MKEGRNDITRRTVGCPKGSRCFKRNVCFQKKKNVCFPREESICYPKAEIVSFKLQKTLFPNDEIVVLQKEDSVLEEKFVSKLQKSLFWKKTMLLEEGNYVSKRKKSSF